MRGSILVVISDTHFGSTLSVAPPKYVLHNRNTLEEQVVVANKVQNWLYNNWLDFWEYVKFRQGRKRRLIVVHCGDVVESVHHQSTQLVAEVEDQINIALELLEPIRNRANAFYGVLGTPTHSGVDGSTEARIYKELDIDFGNTITLDIDGQIHHFFHHGRASSRPWTSSAAGLAAEVIIDFAQQGLPLPNFIWTGHRHKVGDSGIQNKGTRAISLPAWQLKTSYAWKVASSTARSDIGGAIVVDGVPDFSKMRYMGQPDKVRMIKC